MTKMSHWTIHNEDKSHLHWGRHRQPTLNCSSVWNFLNGILKCFLNNLKTSSVQVWLELSPKWRYYFNQTKMEENKTFWKEKQNEIKQSHNCTQWIWITCSFLTLVWNPVYPYMCIYYTTHTHIYYSHTYIQTHAHTCNLPFIPL